MRFELCAYIINMFASTWKLEAMSGPFCGWGEVSVVTGSAVLNSGIKRADATGVDV